MTERQTRMGRPGHVDDDADEADRENAGLAVADALVPANVRIQLRRSKAAPLVVDPALEKHDVVDSERELVFRLALELQP